MEKNGGSLRHRLVEVFNRVRPRFMQRHVNSREYWKRRYELGGDSGHGSRGDYLEYKATYINDLIKRLGVRTYLDLGFGDGRLANLIRVPEYLGLDVSPLLVKKQREQSHSGDKRFELLENFDASLRFDLAASIDVVYHLVEDSVYFDHLGTLFGAASKHVIIFSSDFQGFGATHVRHRNFSNDVERMFPDWEIVQFDDSNPTDSFARFALFSKR